MTYKPLNITNNRLSNDTASGAVEGVDIKSNPQLLNPTQALNLQNYNIVADGRMVKRKGRTDNITVPGETEVKVLATIGQHKIIAYGTTVTDYYEPTDTLTILKSDFPTTGEFVADSAGDYVYVTKGDGVYQIKYKRGAELVTPAAWEIDYQTSGTNQIAEYDATTGTRIYTIEGNGTAEVDLSAVVGDRFEINAQIPNWNSFEASAHSFNWSRIYGCFDDYYLAETQEVQTFILTAQSTDNFKLNTLLSYATTVSSFYTPTGTIDGVNKVFTIGNYSRYLDVLIDGSGTPATDWVLDGLTLTLNTAPTATLEVRHNPGIDSPVFYQNVSIKKILEDELDIELFSSERGSVMKIIDGRMHLGNYPGDPARRKYSSVGMYDDVPSIGWTIGILNNNAGEIRSTYGAVKGIDTLGSVIKTFYENGESGTAIELGATNKTDVVYYNTPTSGLQGGLTATPQGLVVPNKQGIWLKTTGAASDIPYSDTQEKISSNLDYFENYDFTNAAGIYYQPLNITLIACATDSDINNTVLVYFHDFGSWGYYSGWNINSFVLDDGDLFAGSSIDGKVYKLFDGDSDGDNEIWTVMYQELQVGDINTSKRLTKEWFSGKLSISTDIQVDFDIFDRTGRFIPSKVTMHWTANSPDGALGGVGSAPIGSPIGGDLDEGGLVNSFVGGATEIPDFQRIRVKFTEHSKLPHEIAWLRLKTYEKDEITARSLSTLSLPLSEALLTEDGEPILAESGATIIIE
ncbi:MAG: hypothetical protein D4S01_11260 [Dehalococcoidia bacterium]|nr:MAG: hypothetical protein D4S01_11260 [Dehalococcoidia bacterium]